ncbi:MAG: hypothetical protein ABR953_05600 [Candidatus Acidiferrales bacterium]|jgi:hypothetical protein
MYRDIRIGAWHPPPLRDFPLNHSSPDFVEAIRDERVGSDHSPDSRAGLVTKGQDAFEPPTCAPKVIPRPQNNAASIIAILLTLTLCYVVAVREKYEYANGLLNIVFVVIGYYFGSKRQKESSDDEE